MNTLNKEDILKYDNVPVNVASKYLDVTPMFVRMGLRLNRLPFGSAVQTSGKEDGKWSYQISPGALVNWKEGKSLQEWISANETYLKTLLTE